jgi:hypothetical protein
MRPAFRFPKNSANPLLAFAAGFRCSVMEGPLPSQSNNQSRLEKDRN